MNIGKNPMDGIDEVLGEPKLKFWDVDSKGNITFLPDNKLYVTSEELTAENHLDHFLTKTEMHKGGYEAQCEFYKAYIQALQNAGVKSITIDVERPIDLIK